MNGAKILTEIEDGILTITLNCPEKLNAFDLDMQPGHYQTWILMCRAASAGIIEQRPPV